MRRNNFCKMIIMACIFTFIMCIGCVSIAIDPETCAHQYKVNSRCVTCGKCFHPSLEKGYCKQCGYCRHVITTSNYTPATCTGYGSSSYKCEMCKKELNKKTFLPLGHNYVNGKCSVCGANKECEHKNLRYEDLKNLEHRAVCNDCKKQVGKPEQHKFEVKYNDNVHWVECFCGYQTEKYPHEYTDAICKTCGKVREANKECEHKNLRYEDLKNNTHRAVCDDCKKQVGEPVKHDNKAKYNDNEHWGECICGYQGRKDPHIYTDGICKPCGKICEHKDLRYEDLKNNTHRAVCDDCKKQVGGPEQHNFVNDKCNKCGALQTTAVTPTTPGQNPGTDLGTNSDKSEAVCTHPSFIYKTLRDGTHKKVCTKCKKQVGDPIEHKYSEKITQKATCTKEGKRYKNMYMWNHRNLYNTKIRS